MAKQGVTLDLDEHDAVTRSLARALLVSEIAAQVLACFLVLEMLERGSISTTITWHAKQWLARVRYRAQRESEWRSSLGRMLFELHEIERGASHGQG